VKLEILDAKGNLVRRFASDDPLEPTPEQIARELIPSYWIAMPTHLPAERGLHRWIWDLHYPDPVTTTRGYPFRQVPHATPQEPQGPLALPGSYLVRLTVDGHRAEATLSLKPDPRVKEPEGALEAQFQLASSLAELLTNTSRALMASESAQAQLQARATKQPPCPSPRPTPTRLSDAISPLKEIHGQVGDAVQGRPARRRCTERSPRSAPVMRYKRKHCRCSGRGINFRANVPALNRKLRSAGLAPLRPELPAPRDLNVADEE